MNQESRELKRRRWENGGTFVRKPMKFSSAATGGVGFHSNRSISEAGGLDFIGFHAPEELAGSICINLMHPSDWRVSISMNFMRLRNWRIEFASISCIRVTGESRFQ